MNMVKKKKNYIAFVIVAIFVLAILATILIKNNKKNVNAPAASLSDEQDVAMVDKNIEDTVTAQDDDKISKVSLTTGQLVDATTLDKEDFNGFAGLPVFGEVGNNDTEQGPVIISNDKRKAIVPVSVFDTSAKSNQLDEAQPIISTAEYTCDILQKKCETSNLLSQAYQGLDPKLQVKYGSMSWVKWDSVKNILLGHLSSDSLGDVSPVYVCDTVNKKCDKTEGFDSLKAGDQKAVAPEGMFSPTLAKFVMINQHDKPNEETGKTWDLLLYASNDLVKPLKTYDISVIIDHDESVAYDSVSAVSWSQDEKKIAIATTHKIFMFDVESGGLSLAYIEPATDDGDFNWDNSRIVLSSATDSIMFVKQVDEVVAPVVAGASDDDQPDPTYINALEKIDLKNGNKVSELLRGPSLSIK